MYTININLPGGEVDFAALQQGVNDMALNLKDLQREVAENGEVIASAAALIGSLAQEIRENAGNQEALNELANRLDQNSNALGEAIAANTEAKEELPNEEPTEVVGNEPSEEDMGNDTPSDSGSETGSTEEAEPITDTSADNTTGTQS